MDEPIPDEPTPDDKDWTWVLQRPCPQCGFDSSQHTSAGLGAEFRADAARWRTLLANDDVRRRPEPRVWSALEYGCHVRDVYVLYLYRLNLMLTEDAPTFPNWDQDRTAIAEHYGEQDPKQVAHDLAVAAGRLADAFDKVRGAEWQRRGLRSDGAEFTIETFGLYLLHDPVHHVWDVEQGYAALESSN
ncbi:MAG TPA: DinB family protein [Microthrixaceae bacterium]|nr:DinB family protein [Microthrixaceae bacterium]